MHPISVKITNIVLQKAHTHRIKFMYTMRDFSRTKEFNLNLNLKLEQTA